MEGIMGEMRTQKKNADKANPVPFGMERLTKRQYQRDRLKNGTPQERADFLAQNGQEAMLRLVRGNNG